MTQATVDTPNPAPAAAANVPPAVPSLDDIAAKMAAMRNQSAATRQTATGIPDEVNAESPVAPQPEMEASPEDPEAAPPDELDPQAEESAPVVSADTAEDTTAQEIIDFIEFAETNPNAKFRFTRNGKEVIIDAKKAAAILGQGGAIHEEARELKIKRSEFEEYEREARARHEGLALAMEFTIEPRLKQAYDEILRTQNYQTTFAQQLQQTQDPAQQARIRASMEQNERYIQQQSQAIAGLKPQVDQFRQIRQQQVSHVLENNRKNFQDKELRNQYVFQEIRDKVARDWRDAEGELIPGVRNIDLVSSDEHIMGLLRDGLKFRDRPGVKSAGASLAALQGRRTTSVNGRDPEQDISALRDRAKSGDKKAADNLLMAQLNRLRAGRRGVKTN